MLEPLIFYKNPKRRKRKMVFSSFTMLMAFVLIYYLPYAVVCVSMGFVIAIELYLLYFFMANKSTVIVNEKGIKSNVNGI